MLKEKPSKTVNKNQKGEGLYEKNLAADDNRKLNQIHLCTIITGLQQNLKKLKNVHKSLLKSNTYQFQKTFSLGNFRQFRRFKLNQKPLLHGLDPKNKNKNIKQLPKFKQRKQNYGKNSTTSQTIGSKNLHEHGSTMLSIHNADVGEVKKAYQLAFGKSNSNIIELYHFFRKNIQKSTRFHGGSILVSNHPPIDQSDFFGSHKTINPKRQNQQNVVIERHKQGQEQFNAPNFLLDQASQTYKRPAHCASTMEERFKNGCPDLANAYDFIKKRTISKKDMKFLQDKENQFELDNLAKINKEVKSKVNWGLNLKTKKKKKSVLSNLQDRIAPQSPQERISQQCFQKIVNILSSKKRDEQFDLSDYKYLQSKSSNRSKKSSIKKSQKRELQFDLDQNLSKIEIKEFFQTDRLANQKNDEQKAKIFQNCIKKQIINFAEKQAGNRKETLNYLKNELCISKEKLSGPKKGQVQVGLQQQKHLSIEKSNSLEGCQISIKQSSRIIDLDFITLDL